MTGSDAGGGVRASARRPGEGVSCFVIRRSLRTLISVAPEAAAILCVVGLIWWGIAGTLRVQRDNALETAARDTANLAHAFEENTERIVAGGDQVLLALRAAYVRDGAKFDLLEWVKHESPPDWLMAQLGVIGPDGMSVASTASSPKVNLADREHFKVQRESQKDELFISKPVIGRMSGRSTIQLTRKVVLPNGDFAGVVVLSIDCAQLSTFYEKLHLRQGYVELFGTDGVIRARGPFRQELIGASVRTDDPKLQRRAAAFDTFRIHSGRDTLTVSYRRLPLYPLAVEVAFADKSVLAAYRRTFVAMMWAGTLATLLTTGLGIIWIRQRHRSIAFQKALSLTLESMDQGLIMIDESERVGVVNARALELLGLPARTLATLRAARSPKRGRVERELLAALRQRLIQQPLYAPKSVHGTILEGNISRIAGGGLVHIISDVTARHLADQRIRHMALHDHLTGLGNRAAFVDETDHLLAASVDNGQPFGIVCLDLEGFKRVNDTFGHDGGDEMLIEVARRLQAAVSTGDLVARSGGDEFAVVSRGCRQPEASEATAARIMAAFGKPFTVSGQQVRLGASIGIAVFPTNGQTRPELLCNADLALYAAKSDRSSPIRIFEPDMADGVHDRLRLEEEMRAALGTDEFELHYQPQFRASSLVTVAFEALIRWNHPTRGLMRPDLFIPMAEETGLIVPLGRQILERACLAALQWPHDIGIAVNLSPVQFRDADLLPSVVSILARTGLAPSRLELEVTEGVLIGDETQAFQKLSALRQLGVKVALDDFGTGYASLSYLRSYPFDTIKLDRSFIQAQVLEERSRHILGSILDLSRKLKLNVVAEGIETRTQLRLLREQGCPVVQGFLVGRPMLEHATVRMFVSAAMTDLSAEVSQRPSRLGINEPQS